MKSTAHIWQITDGKRGHENQTIGLVEALARQIPVTIETLNISAKKASWLDVMLKKFGYETNSKSPTFVIGTGSRTHSTILAASRATRSRAICIMAPAKPIQRLFDLCIVPKHDNRSGHNIITTAGAINRIEPSNQLNQKMGLILIGGPSAHHHWDESALITQIQAIVSTNHSMNWTLTTSRRTPQKTVSTLINLPNQNLKVVPFEQTNEKWLPEQLKTNGCVWVTEDSVSMVYEALSSGAHVGILPVPRKQSTSRVIRGLDFLLKEGKIINATSETYDLSQSTGHKPLQEADRIANYLIEKFLQ